MEAGYSCSDECGCEHCHRIQAAYDALAARLAAVAPEDMAWEQELVRMIQRYDGECRKAELRLATAQHVVDDWQRKLAALRLAVQVRHEFQARAETGEPT